MGVHQVTALIDHLTLKLVGRRMCVVPKIIEEMMHHFMLSFGPHCYLMCVGGAILLKRCKQLGQQTKADYHATVHG